MWIVLSLAELRVIVWFHLEARRDIPHLIRFALFFLVKYL